MLKLEEKSLAHYAIQRRLARGGMSEVYLASDKRTQQAVAIKVVNRCEDDFFIRFQREVKTLSALSHKHILPIIEFGEHGSWLYCVMPYIEYGTLRDRIAKGPLTQEEAGQVLIQIASALQFAHNHGILHRDIKPSNILLKDEQHVYLADFGLAKDIREGSSLTQTGCLIGTPEYMAPELAETPASTSSDIYAVGIVLYQMLTGQVPFKGSTPLSIYWKHIKDAPKPPSQLNPTISQSVEQVMLCALEKDPQQRFKTIQALVRAYIQALHPEQDTLDGEMPEELRGIRLSPPTQRIILMPAAGTRPRRIQAAFATLVAALFLILIPLTLGFSAYKNDAPLALGASVQFAKTAGTLHELPARPRSVPQRTHSTLAPTSSNNGKAYDNQSNAGQGHQGGGNGHGHRRGHGHGHNG